LFRCRWFGLPVVGALIVSLAAGPQVVRAADAYEVNVILPMTGGAAFLGQSESTSYKVIESIVNGSGGIKGRPIKFTILDDQSNPQVAVQLASQVIAKGVPVLLGPSVSAMCGAITSLVAKGPVAYCYSPAIHPAPGSNQFSASVNTGDLAAISVRYFRLKGWTKFALITTTDATGQDFDHQMDAVLALPENRNVKLTSREHFGNGDLTVAAQIARIKSANPQALLAWTTGTPLATVLHGARDAGLDVPVLTSPSNMNLAQLESMAGFLPSMLVFPGNRVEAPEGTLPGPIKDAQTKYFNGFKALGLRPDHGNSVNWDATMIVVEALRKYGPEATSEQIHDFIETLHGWPGTNGLYDFRDGSQRGIGQLGALILRWDAAKKVYAVASRPGGYLH
jgi:branched-chain amino acid transport system substrate-binding protein